MFPYLSLAGVVKIVCACIMAVMMLGFAPLVFKHSTFTNNHAIVQQTLPERISSTEARLTNLEQRVGNLESIKLGERLSVIETRQEAVLGMLLPIALFLFTHTLEVIQRMRGKNKGGQ